MTEVVRSGAALLLLRCLLASNGRRAVVIEQLDGKLQVFPAFVVQPMGGIFTQRFVVGDDLHPITCPVSRLDRPAAVELLHHPHVVLNDFPRVKKRQQLPGGGLKAYVPLQVLEVPGRLLDAL